METNPVARSYSAPLNYPLHLSSLERPGRALFSQSDWAALGRKLNLTKRQLEVAELVCEELTYSDIATRMGISVNTVRMHMRALFFTLGVRDRVGVVLRLVLSHRSLLNDEAKAVIK